VQQKVSAPVDRELAQSRMYQAINDLSLNIQQRITALTQLTQLVGRPVEKVAAPGPDLISGPKSEEEALQKAIAESPTLARIAAQEKAAGADVDSQKATLWPTLAVRYQRNLGGIAGLPDSQLLLVLQAQPGAGLSAMSNIDAARSRQSALEYQRESALRDLQERVGTDWNELRFSRERLENAELSRTTSARVFESFTQQFTTGRKTWIDVLNAVREFTQAEFSVADAQAQVAGAALRLSVVSGSLKAPSP
jgi:adhesin transport system outer membrane protein